MGTTMDRWVGRGALVTLAAAQLMLIVDVVVANIALPSIGRDLQMDETQLPLVGVAYTLLFGSLLIIGGRAGDYFGRRRILRIGLVVFTLASVLAATASGATSLLAARGLQGIGAAMISPNALALLLATFAEGASRNRAFGLWAAATSTGAVLGQVLGGLIAATVGWPWIFLINVPVAGITLIATQRFLRESSTGGDRRLDVLGAVLLTGALAALSIGLTLLPGGGLPAALGWLALATALVAAFVLAERRHPNPLVRLSLVAIPGVRIGNPILILNAGALTGALFFATLYLQQVLDYSPLAVGLGFAPVTLIVVAVSPVAGRLIARFGARRLLITGGLLVAAGMAWLARLPAVGSYFVDVMPGLALLALGSGLNYAPVFATATSGVSVDEQGLASGLVNTSQELGQALGLALLGAVAAASGAVLLNGYRTGYIAATMLVLVAVLLATRLPFSIGRETAAEVGVDTSTEAVAA
jgi:EmrB/QacA subfamily drug resistance transporter